MSETKENLNLDCVNIRYKCDCGKIQTRKEMRREFDFGYDQLCCTDCGDVLIDDLHGVTHCNAC